MYKNEFDVYILISAQTMPLPSGGHVSQIPHWFCSHNNEQIHKIGQVELVAINKR